MEKLQPSLRFLEYTKDWQKTQLKEMGIFVGGGTPDTNNQEYWNGEINWFTPTEIKTDFVDHSIRKISMLGLNKSSAKLLPKGTILITTRATIGDVSIANYECSTNQGFQSLITNEDNDKYFIFNWLKRSKHLLMERANGSTFSEISKSELEKITIYKPTLDEQFKIGNFLSSVDSKIRLLSDKKRALEKYNTGIKQKIFSQEIRLNDDENKSYPDWKNVKLQSLCDYKNGGSFENYVCKDGKYNLISLNSIDINGKIKKEHKKVSVTDNSLNKGDLIMVLSDVAHGNFLGLTDIVPGDNFVLNQRMGALKPIKEINNFYLKTFINFNQKYFKLMGQGSSQLNLSKGDVLNFPVKLPSIAEQNKIAEFLSSIEEKIEKINFQLDKTKDFKIGLLQQMYI